MELVLERIFEGNRSTEERQGEETAVQKYLAYQVVDGVKVTGAAFTEDQLTSNPVYVSQIKALTAPGGRKFQRFEVSRFQSATYELELSVYFSKNGRYGGPVVRPPVTEQGRLEVAAVTELREFLIPMLILETAIAPGSSELVEFQSAVVRPDVTPITTITIDIPRPDFTVGIARQINQQVNQLHIIPDLAGNQNLYRFKGARNIRQTGDGYIYRYEWEFDIGSPAREWNGDSPPKVFGDLSDPTTGNVVVAGVPFNRAGGWWRPPYCQVAIGTIQVPAPNDPDSFVDVPGPVFVIDGLTDNPLDGFSRLPGLSGE